MLSATMETVRVRYFSDILCVWAYIGQVRLDELRANFPDQVQIEEHFCSVFGCLVSKLEANWASRGGLPACAAHWVQLTEKYPHVSIHPEILQGKIAASSLSAHAFLCAIRILEPQLEAGTYQKVCWAVREAFFKDRVDVSSRRAQLELAEKLGLPLAAIEERLDDGSAHAALSRDYSLARDLQVNLSPTLVLDEGRQRLNGNVGYRVIEANVRELLRGPVAAQASWC